MAETVEMGRLLGEIEAFKNEFRLRLSEIETLIRIAEAGEDSVLAAVIAAEDRSHIRVWRERASEDLQSVRDLGVIFEVKQQDPYVLPQFTPEIFQGANNLAGSLLMRLTDPAED